MKNLRKENSDFSTWIWNILAKGDLESKLAEPPNVIDWEEEIIPYSFLEPTRNPSYQFSHKKNKFPKNFTDPKNVAIALHTFANHELIAIEMMAQALLLFCNNQKIDKNFRKSIVKTIQDEQKHFKLYVARLNELGYEFGDFELTGFLWKQMKFVMTPSQYYSVVAITFEGANLDFAYYYYKIFLELGDSKTADILLEVYFDEITHVAFGKSYLEKWRADKDLWNYYLENLPSPLTPSRAKGIEFNQIARIKAGLDHSFVESLENYQDDFKVTFRKQWKK